MTTKTTTKPKKIALIGNSNIAKLSEFIIHRRQTILTPYGLTDAPILFGKIGQCEIAFLARQGLNDLVLPDNINYRANIWALREIEADYVISISSVCALRNDWEIGDLIIPHDLIDDTQGRNETFSDNRQPMKYVDFRQPYDPILSQMICQLANQNQLPIINQAVYACTQGNRALTLAEMARLQKDGADIYGMTGMPEAILARELDLSYIQLCGVIGNPISSEPPFRQDGLAYQQMMKAMTKLILKLENLNEI